MCFTLPVLLVLSTFFSRFLCLWNNIYNIWDLSKKVSSSKVRATRRRKKICKVIHVHVINIKYNTFQDFLFFFFLFHIQSCWSFSFSISFICSTSTRWVLLSLFACLPFFSFYSSSLYLELLRFHEIRLCIMYTRNILNLTYNISHTAVDEKWGIIVNVLRDIVLCERWFFFLLLLLGEAQSTYNNNIQVWSICNATNKLAQEYPQCWGWCWYDFEGVLAVDISTSQ